MDSIDPSEYWRFWKCLQDKTSQSDTIEASTLALQYRASNSPPNCTEFDHTDINEIKNFILHYGAANEMTIDNVPNDILNAPISQGEIKNAIRQPKLT